MLLWVFCILVVNLHNGLSCMSCLSKLVVCPQQIIYPEEHNRPTGQLAFKVYSIYLLNAMVACACTYGYPHLL
jgi:hypothetical protein